MTDEGSNNIRTVLVANRGEIALRIMRACREEGLRAVAVYTTGEEAAEHVRYADESVLLSSDQPLPYIDIDAVIRAALDAGAQAIHPGYGFLAENPRFAKRCEESGLIFVGPPAEAIRIMGDKVEARAAAVRAGVPVVPGSDGPVDADGARDFGEQVGFPIALKAAAGGGGRGFRVVQSADDVQAGLDAARGEAERYFGDSTVYAEKYLERPRHIEIQVMADRHGNVVALGERDCSIQRRHQKLIEEAPSPALDPETRQAMNATAEQLARAVDYVGAGTVEFLYSDGNFYFLEMNTRIQVEHPITEEITGIDLVREQLRVAAGKPLSFDVMPTLHGHAIECRINAEDPAQDFSPTPGKLTAYDPPRGFGIRVDTGYGAGDEIDARFDNLIAKLVVWGRDRDEALSRLDRALSDFEVEGVATTISLYRLLVRRPDFAAGEYDTRYLERSQVASTLEPWQPVSPAEGDEGEIVEVIVNGRLYRVQLPDGWAAGGGAATARRPRQAKKRSSDGSSGSAPAGNDLTSPIQGTVLSVAVQEGDEVQIGDIICVVEAMKMENELAAHRAGKVAELRVTAGETVKTGQVVAVIDG